MLNLAARKEVFADLRESFEEGRRSVLAHSPEEALFARKALRRCGLKMAGIELGVTGKIYYVWFYGFSLRGKNS